MFVVKSKKSDWEGENREHGGRGGGANKNKKRTRRMARWSVCEAEGSKNWESAEDLGERICPASGSVDWWGKPSPALRNDRVSTGRDARSTVAQWLQLYCVCTYNGLHKLR